MAVEHPYTTEALVTRLVGELGIDLRADDDETSQDDFMDDAIDAGTVDADFYLTDYLQSALAADRWVQECATWFAVRRWCQRRLNDVPAAVTQRCEALEKKLELVAMRRRPLRVAKSRRAAVVTSHKVDLRQPNNQVRVDPNRSTGVAKDYRRPTDQTSPDSR